MSWWSSVAEPDGLDIAALSRLVPGDSFVLRDDEPVTRLALALYAGGSGDHHPMHVDSDFARAHGMDDVIAHGMYTYARMLRMVTGRWSQRALKRCRVRFTSPVRVGARLTLHATTQSVVTTPAEHEVTLSVTLSDANGATKLSGEMVLACPPPQFETNPSQRKHP